MGVNKKFSADEYKTKDEVKNKIAEIDNRLQKKDYINNHEAWKLRAIRAVLYKRLNALEEAC